MKKSLLALAALTAFAGAASAQSSVVISGGIDLGVARLGKDVAGKGETDTVLQTAGKSARSNLTFRGKEDLGGGMYASFYLNHRFNPENGTVNPGGNRESTDNQFWRNSFVELGGGWGAVRLGRYLAPIQELNGNYDAFGTDTVGSVHVNGYGNVRANSAVEYRTPVMGGFKAFLMIASSQGQGSAPPTNTKKPVGLGIEYSGGPFSIAYGYDKKADDRVMNGLYAAYDWGSGAVMGQYESAEAVVGSSDKTKRYSISTKIPFGAMALKAGYARWSDEEIRKFGLGVDYNLSKRTQLYADMGKISGDGATEGMKKTMFDIGIYHKF
jgi:predicted porin